MTRRVPFTEVYEVTCPTCGAKPREYCGSIRSWISYTPHAARKALVTGLSYGQKARATANFPHGSMGEYL